MKITSPAKALKICALATVIAVSFAARGGQFNPYWDSGFDTATTPLSEVVSVACVNGTIFAATYSSASPDSIAIMRGTKCGDWEDIGDVRAGPIVLYAKGNYLYVGGSLDSVFGIPNSILATNVAKYDITQNKWYPVGDGSFAEGSFVSSLVIDSQDHLYIGVSYPGPNFRMLNGTSWMTVGGGLADGEYVAYVGALAADGTDIYLGGTFGGAYNGGDFVISTNIVKWNGSTFEAMGLPTDGWTVLDAGGVSDIAVAGDTVFVAGYFAPNANVSPYPPGPVWSSPAQVPPFHLARYSKASHHRVGLQGVYIGPGTTQDQNGNNITFYTVPTGTSDHLTVQNGSVYLAGRFDGIYDYESHIDTRGSNIVRWDGTTWSALGSGLPWEVYALASDANSVYAGEIAFIEGATLKGFERWVTGPDTPVISGFSPSAGPAGTVVTITGANFSPVNADNIVYFGAVQATVTAASATSLTVIVPVGATYAPISETFCGLTAYANTPFMPTYSGSGQINYLSLGSRLDLPTGTGPARTLIADLDGDGKPDLIVGDSYAGMITIYTNNSSSGTLSAASFGPRVDLPVLAGSYCNPYTIVVADVDGDGKLDLIALNADNNEVSILRNTSTPGNLSFAARIDFSAGNVMRGLAVQDLNGDGKPDIVTANWGDNSISIFQNKSTVGSISFASRVDFPAGNGTAGVAIGDLDGDGYPDVAAINTSSSSTISVFRNLGAGGNITGSSFASKVDFPALANSVAITIGDLDGDGKPELLTTGNSAKLAVYRNTSTPGSIAFNSFASEVDFAVGGRGHTIALGDLDGDGKPDIAIVTELNSVLSLFHNQSSPGSITLGNRVDFATGYNAWGVSIGDLDGDGRPDIIFANTYNGTLSIYQNVMPH